MKRNIALTLAAALLCLMLAGCGAAATQETPAPAADPTPGGDPRRRGR